jgi:O-antigen/teichoic acid export membrane protein
VVFNIVANLRVIPAYSYKGAAVVTILSEIVLLIPFYYSVRKHLGRLPWFSLFWKPAVASLVMAAVMWLVADLPWLLLIPVGAAVYLVVLALVGGFRQPDMDLLRALVPSEGLRTRMSRAE